LSSEAVIAMEFRGRIAAIFLKLPLVLNRPASLLGVQGSFILPCACTASLWGLESRSFPNMPSSWSLRRLNMTYRAQPGNFSAYPH
jgi:hypothetical protein